MSSEPCATAGPYLTAKLRALDARLLALVPRVLSPMHDDDAVHDLRVALRRTRTVLEVGRGVFGPFHADEVRVTLRGLQRASGALRDEEVLRELVRSLPLRDPNVTAWMEIRRRRERSFRGKLMRLIRAGELDRGHRMLDALLAFRIDPTRDRRLAKFARRAVADARRRVERRTTARADDPRALHQLRIAYKRLRYALETFADALPNGATAQAQRASRLQNRLGAVHDVDVAIGCVRRARALSVEARTQLLAALEEVRGERMAAYSSEMAPVAYVADGRVQASGTVGLRKTSTF